MLSVKLADSRLEKMKVTLFAVLVTLFAASVAAKKNPVLAEDFSAEVIIIIINIIIIKTVMKINDSLYTNNR